MTVKSLLIAFALIISPQLHANNLFKLTKEPLTLKRCSYTYTGNALDLALSNPGYFVVSNGKKDSSLYFTRIGDFYLDEDYYVRAATGDYLLALKNKLDPNSLSKIKIPTKNLPPKATSKVAMVLNLNAGLRENDYYLTSTTIYDSLSNAHVLNIKFIKKETSNTWATQISVGNVVVGEGTLTFNSDGTLLKQEGLRHIQWATDYGLHELKIDFRDSTQFGWQFSILSVDNDGYPLGIISALDISRDGEIELLYSNGVVKTLTGRIAVALFTNPQYLEHAIGNLYKPTEKSGPAKIHWAYSDHAVLSGALEEESCLVK